MATKMYVIYGMYISDLGKFFVQGENTTGNTYESGDLIKIKRTPQQKESELAVVLGFGGGFLYMCMKYHLTEPIYQDSICLFDRG